MPSKYLLLKKKKNLFYFIVLCLFSCLLSFIFANQALAATWDYEGKTFYAKQLNDSTGIPVHRFWSDIYKSHFYTISEEEKNQVIQKWGDVWIYEGPVFYANTDQLPNTKPVYRFWSEQFQSHFYTISEEEKNYVKNNLADVWTFEGPVFYAYSYNAAKSTPVYRFWSEVYNSHFYTISEEEKNHIIETWGQDDIIDSGDLGPDIRVGLLKYDKNYSKDNSMRIEANKDYIIKDEDGKILGTAKADDETRVKYDGKGELRVYKSIDDTNVDGEVNFEAADGNNENMIFKVEPKNFDEYRGKIRILYVDEVDGEEYEQVWAINILPLEHYVWGMGEITGTGDSEYNKVMTTLFRTYGYKKMIDGIRNKKLGFDVDVTAGNQVYYGYDWEEDHQRIKEAAKITRGKMVTYDDNVIWTAYSSGTDGRTRSWEEVWGSSNYPYCVSVADPWGVISDAKTRPGNHMVGLSATGAVNLADDENKDYDEIIKHYYTDVDIDQMY
jgi:hypothetical protein